MSPRLANARALAIQRAVTNLAPAACSQFTETSASARSKLRDLSEHSTFMLHIQLMLSRGTIISGHYLRSMRASSRAFYPAPHAKAFVTEETAAMGDQ